jgi:hypothetical protein
VVDRRCAAIIASVSRRMTVCFVVSLAYMPSHLAFFPVRSDFSKPHHTDRPTRCTGRHMGGLLPHTRLLFASPIPSAQLDRQLA